MKGRQLELIPGGIDEVKDRYWRTPPDLMARLQAEFHFDGDACPFPRPAGWDALKAEEWPGSSVWVNPPFEHGVGLVPWAEKAIEQSRKGKQIVLIASVNRLADITDRLLGAGAEARLLPSVRWLNSKGEELPERKPGHGRHPCVLFILRPYTR
jgi:hypothetical protein